MLAPQLEEKATDEITLWMNMAGSYKLLDQEQIDELSRLKSKYETSSKEYMEIVNKITSHNLRLVIRFVTNFLNNKTAKKFGCPETVDYLQVGAMGLRRAAELYKPELGFRFSTYANQWMRSFIGRHNMKNISPFNISENALRESWQYQKYGRVIGKGLNRNRSEAEYQQTYEIIKSMRNYYSLDTSFPTNTESDLPIVDLIESHYCEYIPDNEFTIEIEEVVMCSNLSEVQIKIIKDNFLRGLELGEISQNIGLAIEEVVSLKNKALRKIKKSVEQGIISL
jgi:RNA polymerase sigma factor (sigma-70 family)